MEAGDAIERSANGGAGRLQIMAGLDVTPEFRLDSKESPEPQCCVCGG
ncbi:MAG TPA: hypothetical protein VGI22_26460 [Xanthobacteraceae bacterium]|jgi:hypothetical protein